MIKAVVNQGGFVVGYEGKTYHTITEIEEFFGANELAPIQELCPCCLKEARPDSYRDANAEERRSGQNYYLYAN